MVADDAAPSRPVHRGALLDKNGFRVRCIQPGSATSPFKTLRTSAPAILGHISIGPRNGPHGQISARKGLFCECGEGLG